LRGEAHAFLGDPVTREILKNDCPVAVGRYDQVVTGSTKADVIAGDIVGEHDDLSHLGSDV